jgi:hypothetical protein
VNELNELNSSLSLTGSEKEQHMHTQLTEQATSHDREVTQLRAAHHTALQQLQNEISQITSSKTEEINALSNALQATKAEM